MNGNRLITRFLVGIALVGCAVLSLYAPEGIQPVIQQQVPHEQDQPTPAFTVKHAVVGKQLRLDLTVSHFRFSLENMGKDNKYGEGHVHLYIDGKKVAKIFDKQFVYSALTPGRHEVVLELAHNNHESYGIKQRFEVVVN